MSAVLNLEDHQGLTRADITSFRKADTVVFRTHADMTSVIEARKRDDKAFGGEREHRVYAKSRHTVYRAEFHHACCVLLSARHTPKWQTLAHYVFRAGDRLMLSWVGRNTSQSMRELGIWLDSLEIMIDRKTKAGNHQILSFELDTNVIFHESAAMIATR